jgi:putative transcriptional regulator
VKQTISRRRERSPCVSGPNKSEHPTMNKKHAFNEKELMASLQETLAHAKDKLTLKTTMLPNSPGKMSPTKIALIRRKLKVSTPVFAAYLNVSADTVRGWEKNRRQPSGPALKLLEIASKTPAVLVG